jgi:uncharacterized protein YecA (UPF0149 family)
MHSKNLMALLGGAAGAVGRCIDILEKHERSKLSAHELAEMQGKLKKALLDIHEVAHSLEERTKLQDIAAHERQVRQVEAFNASPWRPQSAR